MKSSDMQEPRAASASASTRLRQPLSLTAILVQRLLAEIRNGILEPGQKLPSESELAVEYGISRTVVREAVTALKATGHLVSRRGLGTFVEKDIQPTFRITTEELQSLSNILHILELRYAVEGEAAALAAQNRSEPALAGIQAAVDAVDEAMANDRMAVEADFRFHLAIASASGNPYFQRLLESLGTLAIPRQRVNTDLGEPSRREHYLAKIQSEHRAIYDAIAAGNSDRARQAVRRHLAGSRYRNLEVTAKLPDQS